MLVVAAPDGRLQRAVAAPHAQDAGQVAHRVGPKRGSHLRPVLPRDALDRLADDLQDRLPAEALPERLNDRSEDAGLDLTALE